MISVGGLSLRYQCELLGLNRSSLYYLPCSIGEEDRLLMNHIDEEYTRHPFYGSRRMRAFLRSLGFEVNRKRIQRLMGLMGIRGITPGPNLSKRNLAHRIYPYLLKGVQMVRPNQAWGIDITYIRLLHGFVYLVAILDWWSRYVLSWRLSNSLETFFCLEALEEAFKQGVPEVFNTDQGCQFTSEEFIGKLKEKNIRISMDSKGRALDNIFVERLWRSLKYEDIYLKNYETMQEAYAGIGNYFRFYNEERFHQALDYKTPREVYFAKAVEKSASITLPSEEIVVYRANTESVF